MTPHSPYAAVKYHNDVFLSGLYGVKSGTDPSPAQGNITSDEARLSDRLRCWANTLGSPLTCTACRLQVKATERTLAYRLATKYRLRENSEDCFSFVFPVNACDGALASFSARINKKVLLWELVRVVSEPSERPVLLRPAVFDATGSAGNKVGNAGMVHAVCPGASDALDAEEKSAGREILVEIRWTTKSVRRLTNLEAVTIAYPFACAPCLPEEITYQTLFEKTVKVVSSANSPDGRQSLDWRARGRYCLVRLSSEDTERMLKPKDEIFVLTFYFENPLESDQGVTVTVLIVLGVVIAFLTWVLLTKDLVL